MRLILVCLFMAWSVTAFTQHEMGEDGGTFPDYQPIGREEIPSTEKAYNFGGVYATQWAFYYVSQEEIIRTEGSLENWLLNPLSPRFDKDSFEYNIFKHAFVGNYYYLFFRSRNYTEKDSFISSFLASLAFEFTVETITEKPSYQDIYQTPVFGTVLGIGSEKLSNYLHAQGKWYWDTLGYIVNPMTLIPQFARKKIAAVPIIEKNKVGAVVTFGF